MSRRLPHRKGSLARAADPSPLASVPAFAPPAGKDAGRSPAATSERRAVLFALVVGTGVALGSGCSFAHVFAANARWFFRTPAAAPVAGTLLSSTASDTLRVTWVGHATTVLELGARVVVTDPVFVGRVAVLSRRLVAPGLGHEALPAGLVVVISHRHFDHLSRDSLALLAGRIDTIVVPVGAADDVRDVVGDARIVELAWNERVELAPLRGANYPYIHRPKADELDGLTVAAVRVNHHGDRLPWERGGDVAHTAFSGYVIDGGAGRVFFAGDTGRDDDAFRAIGLAHVPIDVALCRSAPCRRLR